MKKISLIGRSHLQKKAFLILPALFLTQSAMGVVTAHIVEEGNDVRVSFSGSISLDPALASTTIPVEDFANLEVSSGNFFKANDDGWFSQFGLGMAIESSVGGVGAEDVSVMGTNSFGFSGSGLLWTAASITGGAVGAVSEITVDPSDSFFVVQDTTLSDVLGTSSGDGDTLWTATTNDTIVISTSPPVLVPEPSSAILCFFAGIGLLRRKDNCNHRLCRPVRGTADRREGVRVLQLVIRLCASTGVSGEGVSSIR